MASLEERSCEKERGAEHGANGYRIPHTATEAGQTGIEFHIWLLRQASHYRSNKQKQNRKPGIVVCTYNCSP